MTGKIDEQNEEKQKVYVAILTPYLTNSLGDFAECAKIDVKEGGLQYTPEEYVQKQSEMFGYDPNNFNGIRTLETENKIIFLETPKDHAIAAPALADLAIAGSTESIEQSIFDLKSTGLIVARYSTFYRRPSGYTQRFPAESGYSLDIPKKVEVVRQFLTDEAVMDALLLRDEDAIRAAIYALNEELEEPIIVTDYLREAIRCTPMQKLLKLKHQGVISDSNLFCKIKELFPENERSVIIEGLNAFKARKFNCN